MAQDERLRTLIRRVVLAARDLPQWRGLAAAPLVYRDPLGSVARYVSRRGSYPHEVVVRTPTGRATLRVFSPEDMVTVHGVFSRGDYRSSPRIAVAVDVGSNIGISAAYFLTRNDAVRCYCFEPNPENIPRLERNLAPFRLRATIDAVAVADFDGEAPLAVEPTGVYGGLTANWPKRITVACRHIASVLTDILERHDRIDVLKVDTEGTEAAILAATPTDLLDRVRIIYVETTDRELVLSGFRRESTLPGRIYRFRGVAS